ncbi:MAG: transposase [Chloroflexales bacterium]
MAKRLAESTDGVTQAQFQFDRETRVATCPMGQTAVGRRHKDGTIRMQMDTDRCASCVLRPRCCTGTGGRRLTFSPGHEALVAARARQETADFKTVYRAHRGGVEGCLSGLVRGQGIRINRYIGRAKNELRALFVGTGVNLRRRPAGWPECARSRARTGWPWPSRQTRSAIQRGAPHRIGGQNPYSSGKVPRASGSLQRHAQR